MLFDTEHNAAKAKYAGIVMISSILGTGKLQKTNTLDCKRRNCEYTIMHCISNLSIITNNYTFINIYVNQIPGKTTERYWTTY